MKTNQELADIGAYAAASWLQSTARGNYLAVKENALSYLGDSAGREAFAAAVAGEVHRESAEEIARLTAELDQAKKMISPYAHLEAAIADGKTIQWHDGKGWVDRLAHDRIFGTFFHPAKDYRVKPDAAPDSNLSGIIDKAIEMVNTPGTTPETLPQAINAKIMQRDACHMETLKKLDTEREATAKLRKELETCQSLRDDNQANYHNAMDEVRRLRDIEKNLRMGLKNCQLIKDDLHYWHQKGTEEIDRLRAELAKHQWRPVSVKPTKEDADVDGYVMDYCKSGNLCKQSVVGVLGSVVISWMPCPKTPTPTAEETERAGFEKWWSCQPSWVHENNTKHAVFMGWQAARAGKKEQQ